MCYAASGCMGSGENGIHYNSHDYRSHPTTLPVNAIFQYKQQVVKMHVICAIMIIILNMAHQNVRKCILNETLCVKEYCNESRSTWVGALVRHAD